MDGMNRKETIIKFTAAAIAAYFAYASLAPFIMNGDPRKAGTDAAGYSIIAENIRSHKHPTDITIDNMPTNAQTIILEEALSSGEEEKHWETGVAPNSFVYNKNTGRISSQYPIGTSLIMAAFDQEEEVRKTLIVSAWAVTALFAVILAKATRIEAVWATLGSYLITMWITKNYITHSFSLFPSVLFMTALGLITTDLAFNIRRGRTSSRKERLCYVLIVFAVGTIVGLSTLLRTNNILLVLPAFFGIIYSASGGKAQLENSHTPAEGNSDQRNFGILIPAMVFLAGITFGLVPLFVSNWILHGDILYVNYPTYDRITNLLPGHIYANLEFFLFRSGPDSILNWVALILMLWCSSVSKKKAKAYWITSVLILFFLGALIGTKVVVTSYYLSMVSIFYLVSATYYIAANPTTLISSQRRGPRALIIFASTFCITIIPLLGFNLPATDSSAYAYDQRTHDLCIDSSIKNKVIWSNEEGGFAYLKCGLYTVRPQRLPNNLAISIYSRLDKEGIEQYIDNETSLSLFKGFAHTPTSEEDISVGHLAFRRLVSLKTNKKD